MRKSLQSSQRNYSVKNGESTRLYLLSWFVAQICNLPYRRFVIGRASEIPRIGSCRRAAECNSAIRQITNLRYAKHIHAPRVLCSVPSRNRKVHPPFHLVRDLNSSSSDRRGRRSEHAKRVCSPKRSE